MDENVPPIPAAPAASLASAPKARAPGGTLAMSALLVASAALALGLYLAKRTTAWERALEQQASLKAAQDLRGVELEQRIAELERQWQQAQASGDSAGPVPGDAELRRRREQLAMIDVERLLEQVQMQLHLGAPAATALDALAAADARLGRLGGVNAQRVQTALRHDVARLKLAPDLDRGTMASRLDPLLASVEEWHPSADPTHPQARVPVAPAASNPAAAEASAGAKIRAWISREFGDLLRIREIDTPEALLLDPAQQRLVRDRVRLGILDLRQAVLARDERTARAEASALEMMLQRYFDPNDPEVHAAIAQLRETAAAVARTTPMSLDETMAALRAARP